MIAWTSLSHVDLFLFLFVIYAVFDGISRPGGPYPRQYLICALYRSRFPLRPLCLGYARAPRLCARAHRVERAPTPFPEVII